MDNKKAKRIAIIIVVLLVFVIISFCFGLIETWHKKQHPDI